MRQEDVIRLNIKGFKRPVEFCKCADFATGFAAILRGWDITESPRSDVREPLIVFRKTLRGFDWTAPWIGRSQLERDEPPITVMEAICDFHYEFIDWYVEEFPQDFCLHCASVKIGDGLIIFPSMQRTGKSLLMMQLAADGQRIFGDDVLTIKQGSDEGVAFGMLPRLRLPLPDTIHPELVEFINSHSGPSDSTHGYIALSDEVLAAYGESSKIHGAVILDRQTTGPAHLKSATNGQILKNMIDQNFATRISPLQIFNRLRKIAVKSRCFTLTYSDTREASALLINEFAGNTQIAKET